MRQSSLMVLESYWRSLAGTVMPLSACLMPGFNPHVTYLRNVANVTFTYLQEVLRMFRKKFRAVSSVTSAAAQIGCIPIFHVSAVCFSQ